MLDLIVEYQKTLKQTRAMANKPENADDASVINSMMHDIQHAIEWMKSGEDPNRHLDVKLDQSYYHRRALYNMDIFPCLELEPTHTRQIQDKKKLAIHRVLSELSERQLTCYLLHAAHMRSYQQIAVELGIKKASVQRHIELARKKIERVLKAI